MPFYAWAPASGYGFWRHAWVNGGLGSIMFGTRLVCLSLLGTRIVCLFLLGAPSPWFVCSFLCMSLLGARICSLSLLGQHGFGLVNLEPFVPRSRTLLAVVDAVRAVTNTTIKAPTGIEFRPSWPTTFGGIKTLFNSGSTKAKVQTSSGGILFFSQASAWGSFQHTWPGS